LDFGAWDLGFVWNLEFVWNLVLGFWNFSPYIRPDISLPEDYK
jgi:hypothetical protein